MHAMWIETSLLSGLLLCVSFSYQFTKCFIIGVISLHPESFPPYCSCGDGNSCIFISRPYATPRAMRLLQIFWLCLSYSRQELVGSTHFGIKHLLNCPVLLMHKALPSTSLSPHFLTLSSEVGNFYRITEIDPKKWRLLISLKISVAQLYPWALRSYDS